MAEPDTDIARSDFILSKIREINNVEQEVYVKWYLAGAFNGAAYRLKLDPEGFGLQVYFYREDRHKRPQIRDASPVLSLPGAAVLIESRDLSPHTEQCVYEADRYFSELTEAGLRQIVSQVRRLQISVGYVSGEREQEARGSEIVQALFGPFKGSVSTTPSVPFFPFEVEDYWNIDGEICFEEVMSEGQVVERLKPLLPKVQSTLYGVGFVSQECALGEVKWIHLAARHF